MTKKRKRVKVPRLCLVDLRQLGEVQQGIDLLTVAVNQLCEKYRELESAIVQLHAEREALKAMFHVAEHSATVLGEIINKRSDAARRANATRRQQAEADGARAAEDISAAEADGTAGD